MPQSSAYSTLKNPELVERFLRKVRGATPLTIEQLETIVQLIATANSDPQRFLDLGCGNAIVSSAIFHEFPAIKGVLLDESAALLDGARRLVGDETSRATFIQADFLKAGWREQILPLAPFDAAISAFALPRATADERKILFGQIYELLRPGAIFLNVEPVASATRWTEVPADDYLIEAIFGDVIKASPKKTRADVAHEYYERARQASRSLVPLEVQCDWLRAAGFEDVECFLKLQEMAVFGGIRAAA
ncbi:MAG: class I SAM-dependent methyltransferase [Chthoniobacteraceae bacterium]